MAGEPISTGSYQGYEGAYLDVVRLEDGRYCVQFVKRDSPLRTSYTAYTDAVVKQAQRAGNIAVHTTDQDLRRMCLDQRVELIERLLIDPNAV